MKPKRSSIRIVHPDALRMLITPIQLRILRGMIGGKNQTQLAGRYHLTARAVHLQIEAARRKTGCMTTSELVAVVVTSGILEDSPQRMATLRAAQEGEHEL